MSATHNIMPAKKLITSPRKRSTWLVHGVAACTTCGKEFTAYKNCQALAAKHARATGHIVTGELGFAFRYEGNT